MQVKCYAWVWKTERESKLEVTDVLWTLCLFPLFANILMTFEIVILGLSNVELRFLYALNGLFNVKINWSSYQKLNDNSKAHWPIKWSIIHHMHLFLFRPCPHESGHFWNRIFFCPYSCGRGHKPPLESWFKTVRFRWPDSLVFCRRSGPIRVQNVCGFKISILEWM